MKIGKPAETPPTDARPRPGSAVSRAAAGKPAAAGHSHSGPVEKAAAVDAVHLSPASRNLVAEGALEGQAVRTHKVEEVQTAIREGRFEVNAYAVADKMITQAAELIETLSRPK